MRRLLVLSLCLLVLPSAWRPAAAAGCFALAGEGTLLHPAAFAPAALPAGVDVRIVYLGHSSFRIESPEGVTAITDYNGTVRADRLPDIVTMNNAHETHFTPFPEPEIPHVLRGWNPEGGPAEHDLVVGDMRVRNVPTAVRGRSGAQELSNSIFVFEIGDLCIAHLGHLHHELTDDQLAELGRIDVLLVPIDGLYTMSQAEMVQVIEQIGPRIVIPMHWFGSALLERFLALVRGRWDIEIRDEPVLDLSLRNLPDRRVIVLPGF